ncbi:MAG: Uma2 family endonuclease [Acidimicrobiia bacterium]|nr:Uma2 family endonuclease [Acidimicrobiia bacterium]
MPTKAGLSEREYLRTSFPDVDPEFRDGEILGRSVPDLKHGTAQLMLGAFFVRHRNSHHLHAASETRLRLRPGRVVIPDVCVFWPDKPDARYPDSPPLIVVEILSRDDPMSQVRAKLLEYLDWGVPHIWLVDPEARVLYEFRQDGLHEVVSYTIQETGLELNPADIFD